MEATEILGSKRYSPSNPEAKLEPYYATNGSLQGDIWRSSLAEGMGDFFKEDVAVLDYGCWIGMFHNFLSERLLRYRYWGLEPSNSKGYGKILRRSWGDESLELARKFFGHDARAKFGFIGGPEEKEAIENADCVILGSIFTHVATSEFASIMLKLDPIVRRGGAVVFSIFLDDKGSLSGPGAYGIPTSYKVAKHSFADFDKFVDQNGLKATFVKNYDIKKYRHLIYRVTKR